MYAKVYQYKFPGISEAKVAAAFCSEKLGQKIDEHNFHGLSILISQEGDLTILIKFDDVDKLRAFDKVASEFVEDLTNQHLPPKSYADQWNTEGLYTAIKDSFNLDLPILAWAEEEGVDDEIVSERIIDAVDKMMAEKAVAFGPQSMRQIEKQILLQTLDTKWREHLLTLEHLRSVVGFRGYAQRDPLNEYKSEAFQLFESLLESLRVDVSQHLSKVRPMTQEEQTAMMQQMMPKNTKTQNDTSKSSLKPTSNNFNENDSTTWGNPGRNDRCPCGSGKKFKHCHGRL